MFIVSLTREPSKTKILVNFDQVEVVSATAKSNANGSTITLAHWESALEVRESPDEILAMVPPSMTSAGCRS